MHQTQTTGDRLERTRKKYPNKQSNNKNYINTEISRTGRKKKERIQKQRINKCINKYMKYIHEINE